jgi:hypothetical protein
LVALLGTAAVAIAADIAAVDIVANAFVFFGCVGMLPCKHHPLVCYSVQELPCERSVHTRN